MAHPDLFVPLGFEGLEEDLKSGKVLCIRYWEHGLVREDYSELIRIRYRAEIVMTEYQDPDSGCYSCDDRETVVPVEDLLTAEVEVGKEPGSFDKLHRLWVRGPNGEFVVTHIKPR
jgi:hypothetical protein